MSRLIPGRESTLVESTQLSPLAGAVLSALSRPPRPELERSLRIRAAVAAPVRPVEEPAKAPARGPAELWESYLATRSRAARDRLILHYTGLVRTVAQRIAAGLPAHVELADLVQSGIFGLIEAIERYQPGRAARFESYAIPRIRGAILDELRAQDWVPRTVRGRQREVERAQERLEARLGRAASDAELAAELDMSLPELRTLVHGVQMLSIEAFETGAGRGGLAETMEDHARPDPMVLAMEQETRRQLAAAVARLEPRDRDVVRMYYLENRTLAEIGQRLGVTESRVCQLHSRLVARLRRFMEEQAAV